MVWVFERDGHRLRCEATRTDDNAGYRIVIAQPDGAATVEDIDAPAALAERAAEVMRNLRAHGWTLA